MDVSFLDSTAHVLGLDRIDKMLTHRHDFLSGSLSLSDSSTDQVSGSGALQISALILDAVAPPPVRPKSRRTTTRLMMRKKKKRLRRRSVAGGGSGGGEDDDGIFGMDGEGGGGGGGGGFFGGGGGDGGSGGWNFGGFGGNSWDESSAASDPASDFVYEVICWIALSNCVHFAFKRVVRGLGDAMGEKGMREKLPMRLGSIC